MVRRSLCRMLRPFGVHRRLVQVCRACGSRRVMPTLDCRCNGEGCSRGVEVCIVRPRAAQEKPNRVIERLVRVPRGHDDVGREEALLIEEIVDTLTTGT